MPARPVLGSLVTVEVAKKGFGGEASLPVEPQWVNSNQPALLQNKGSAAISFRAALNPRKGPKLGSLRG